MLPFITLWDDMFWPFSSLCNMCYFKEQIVYLIYFSRSIDFNKLEHYLIKHLIILLLSNY